MNIPYAGTKEIKDFIEHVKTLNDGVESTSCKRATYSSSLYNVVGSTDDPKIGGKSWLQLLSDYDINISYCYANEPPSPSEPAAAAVGGHMTIHQSGGLMANNTCYLMPLCKWHNNKARDGQAFSHYHDDMLLLSGVIVKESALTFMMRLPTENPYTLLYLYDGAWDFKHFSSESALRLFLASDSKKLTCYHIFDRFSQPGKLKLVSL